MLPRQLLLEVENINCIAVDWKEGAKGTYVSAVNNIRVLGAEVAYFITTLQVKDPSPLLFHNSSAGKGPCCNSLLQLLPFPSAGLGL